jgi:hypothetical protein
MTEEKANLRFVWLSNKGERVNGDAKSQQRRQMLHSHFFEKTDGGVVPRTVCLERVLSDVRMNTKISGDVYYYSPRFQHALLECPTLNCACVVLVSPSFAAFVILSKQMVCSTCTRTHN